MMRNGAIKVICVAACAVAVLGGVEDRVADMGTASGVLGENRGRGALAILAGEFRVVAANLLWVKVDKYHHEYAERHADWTKNSDVLPLIRMITVLDPQFVEAYLTGGWMLATGLNRLGEAEVFLREGIRNNPRDSELHAELAILYARHLHKPKLALTEARRSWKLAKDPFYRERAARLCRSIKRDVRSASP